MGGCVGMREEIRKIFHFNSFCGLFESIGQQDALNVELEALSDIHRLFAVLAAELQIKGFALDLSLSTLPLHKKAACKLRVVAPFLDNKSSPLCRLLLCSRERQEEYSCFQQLWHYTASIHASQERAHNFVKHFFSTGIRPLHQIAFCMTSKEMQNFHFPSMASPIANSDFFSLISNRILIHDAGNSALYNELLSRHLCESFLEHYAQFFIEFFNILPPKNESDLFDNCINGLSGAMNGGKRNESAHWCLFLTPGLETSGALQACYLQTLEIEKEEEFIQVYLSIILDRQICREIFSLTRAHHLPSPGICRLKWKSLFCRQLTEQRFTQVHASFFLVKAALERAKARFEGILPPQVLQDTLKSLLGGIREPFLEANIGSVFGFDRSILTTAILPVWKRYLDCTIGKFEWTERAYVEKDWDRVIIDRLKEWIEWNYHPFTLSTTQQRRQEVMKRLGNDCPELKAMIHRL